MLNGWRVGLVAALFVLLCGFHEARSQGGTQSSQQKGSSQQQPRIQNGVSNTVERSTAPEQGNAQERGREVAKNNDGRVRGVLNLIGLRFIRVIEFLHKNEGAFVALFTFMLTVVTGLLVRRTRQLWEATNGLLAFAAEQAKDMKASIAVNKKAADVAEAALVRLQRAFVFPAQIEVTVDGVGAEKTFNIRVRWENSGSSPALEFRQHVNFARFKGPMHPSYDLLIDRGDLDHRPSYIAPRGSTRSGPLPFTAVQVAEVMRGETTLYLWGWTTYRDIFDGTPDHITRFCWQADPTGDDPAADRGSIMWAFKTHDRGNCVDEDCP